MAITTSEIHSNIAGTVSSWRFEPSQTFFHRPVDVTDTRGRHFAGSEHPRRFRTKGPPQRPLGGSFPESSQCKRFAVAQGGGISISGSGTVVTITSTSIYENTAGKQVSCTPVSNLWAHHNAPMKVPNMKINLLVAIFAREAVS